MHLPPSFGKNRGKSTTHKKLKSAFVRTSTPGKKKRCGKIWDQKGRRNLSTITTNHDNYLSFSQVSCYKYDQILTLLYQSCIILAYRGTNDPSFSSWFKLKNTQLLKDSSFFTCSKILLVKIFPYWNGNVMKYIVAYQFQQVTRYNGAFLLSVKRVWSMNSYIVNTYQSALHIKTIYFVCSPYHLHE